MAEDVKEISVFSQSDGSESLRLNGRESIGMEILQGNVNTYDGCITHSRPRAIVKRGPAR